MLGDLLEDEMGSSLPEAARAMFRTMLDLLEELNEKIGELDKEITRRAREDAVARRLITIPGVDRLRPPHWRLWHRRQKPSPRDGTLRRG
ncbi:hypothetical protein GCM10011393_37800 [Sphingopyxis bauzanensis]|nr:hypothetical protein GCM10011393_37800 [Sphingopyxis bauzanensis]